MYQNVNNLDFIAAFTRMNRADNFSYEALSALFDYYEELEGSTGEKIKLDVIKICCDWTEFENNDELRDSYGADIEYISSNFTVIYLPNGGYLVME